MTGVTFSISQRAAELRHQFDRSFAEPNRPEAALAQDLLAISAGEHPYAIRMAEMLGLHAGKKITRVPGHNAALLGIAGFRGILLPVYDLGVLLGHASGEAPRWLVVASTAPIAFAFAAFQRQLRVTHHEIARQPMPAEKQSYARELVRTQGFIGPILNLPSIVDAVKASAAGMTPREE